MRRPAPKAGTTCTGCRHGDCETCRDLHAHPDKPRQCWCSCRDFFWSMVYR